VASQYEGRRRYEKAFELYQYIEDNLSEEYVILSRGRLIMLDIGLGNDADAQAAIDKLIADFAAHPALPEALNGVADKYRILQRYKQARQLYQYIVDNLPESEYVILSRGGMIMADIGLGNDANAQAALDSLIADFNDHPGLPKAVFVIGEEYYNRAVFLRQNEGLYEEVKEYYRKTLAVWERIITELPESEATIRAQAYLFSAECCRRLSEYDKAVEYFQAVVDNWPDYEYACNAQCLVGECYEKLSKSGSLAESEAIPRIEQAYNGVIERYPDCSLVKYACGRLGRLNFARAQWVDAAMYFELLLQKYQYPLDRRPSRVLYYLGQAYEKMGESDLAARVYGEFINIADPGDPRIKRVEAWLEELGGYNK